MVDILTLRLDEPSQQHFDSLRQQYFPPERNQIPAHLTLFHALPAEPEIAAHLAEAAGTCAGFTLRVTGVRSLGKGVAYKLAAPELQLLHADLATHFADVLISQDKARLQPHVVVQNKTTAAAARQLLEQLTQQFEPWVVTAEGLDLWHYLGGPWQHVHTFPFRQAGS